MRPYRISMPLGGLLLLLVSCGTTKAAASEHLITWPEGVTRTWVGPELWANRLQDWRVADGRLECLEARPGKPMRTVHLLTRHLDNRHGDFHLKVETGLIEAADQVSEHTWSGFLLGAGGAALDYRAASLVHHLPGKGGGLIAALSGSGELIFRDNENPREGDRYPLLNTPSRLAPGARQDWKSGLALELDAVPSAGDYDLTLTAKALGTGQVLARAVLSHVSAARLVGNLALVSHPGDETDRARYWFRNWNVAGNKLSIHDERFFGPVISAQHTLSDGVLKLTAQMVPLGEQDSKTVQLQTRPDANAAWKATATAEIVAPGWTATFRVPAWHSTRDHEYRVAYKLRGANGESKDYYWQGKIRQEPTDKSELVLAAFTGNANVGNGADGSLAEDVSALRWTPHNIWFPHNDVVEHVRQHAPDLLFFSGDQVYETNSPTRAERHPEDKAVLDYLYKWYLWCWAYRDLTRDIPVVAIPDDHDVFQGNVWGWGGRAAPAGDLNNGGYVMSPEFVNMVERTQSSNLPDPFDPTPLASGIGVYYTSLRYGGISFAILEDRKFKSGPPILAEKGVEADIDDGHILTPDFDPTRADVSGTTLLGGRQLEFLRKWAVDWKGVIMKAALSQTLFANLQTRGGKLDMDLDSNGWPQSGRARALRELRKGFAVMIGGDQHLGSVVHHGTDDWNDAGFSFCVPSIANFYVRVWRPRFPLRKPLPSRPEFTGQYLDGWGNKITVWAVANPELPEPRNQQERFAQAMDLHRKAPGYGIIRFHKAERSITVECWPRNADPGDPSGQYPGWPVTFDYLENYGRKAAAYLPTLQVKGLTDPFFQILHDESNEIVYTLRIKGKTFRPKVFKPGSYTVRIGEPGTPQFRTLRGVQPLAEGEESSIDVHF